MFCINVNMVEGSRSSGGFSFFEMYIGSGLGPMALSRRPVLKLHLQLGQKKPLKKKWCALHSCKLTALLARVLATPFTILVFPSQPCALRYNAAASQPQCFGRGTFFPAM